MTRTLILMRHAKSSWNQAGASDHERPLNDRGRRAARAMGDWLRARGHVPDAAVISDSTRTGQTYEGLGFDVPVTFTRALYHADAGGMMEVLRAQQGASVLMLGHNPGSAEFARRLVAVPPEHPRFSDYPTCATTVIGFEAEGWGDVDWGAGAVLDFAIPREVMADGG